MMLKDIFGDCRIIGLAGLKNTGKTNNLVYLIKDFRDKDKKVPIYAYGMPNQVMAFLKRMGVKEISELKHLVKKKDCILILDEFQRLHLNDRRFKDDLDEFVDFIYHNNVYVILSSPNIREFNTIIGGIIERWLLKSINKDNCVNGSQLKKVVLNYKGRYKSLGMIEIPVNKLLLINENEEKLFNCPYVKEADNKLYNPNIFEKCQKVNCQGIVKQNVRKLSRKLSKK